MRELRVYHTRGIRGRVDPCDVSIVPITSFEDLNLKKN